MFLVDSSVWIDLLQERKTPQVKRLVAALEARVEVCVCGPVLTEVLQGIRSRRERGRVRTQMRFPRYLPISRAVYLLGAKLYRAASGIGKQPGSTIDCIIAACAIRHRVPLLHRDQHFDAIAKVSRLQLVACP